jgi:hypothetical protein
MRRKEDLADLPPVVRRAKPGALAPSGVAGLSFKQMKGSRCIEKEMNKVTKAHRRGAVHVGLP